MFLLHVIVSFALYFILILLVETIAVVLAFCLSDQDSQENTLKGGFLILTHSSKGLISSWWRGTAHIMVARMEGPDGRLFGLALSSPYPSWPALTHKLLTSGCFHTSS